ncbi:hypothetical protein FOL46_007972 [Perkinsus olseni]|uniref:Uncharacterized protein n=1 Tax=Perkinsus olseni TaxID=32597 RepID=A0A7J6MN82_PEROL|nr:hypothetical protein FOL46_007972 [Perkinsus olseni]
MTPAEELLREVSRAAAELPAWRESLRPVLKDGLLQHLKEHGLRRFSDIEFPEERQAVMGELFTNHADQLRCLRNCLDALIEEKLTDMLLLDGRGSDEDVLGQATDLAAGAAVMLLDRLRHLNPRVFLSRLVAARPNDRLRRVLWDRLLVKIDIRDSQDPTEVCHGGVEQTLDEALGSYGVRLSRSVVAEVERLVTECPEATPSEPALVCSAVVLVLVYGVSPVNHRRYRKLLSLTQAWDAAVAAATLSSREAPLWLGKRFLDPTIDQECTKLVWDQLLLATPRGAAVAGVVSICTEALLDCLAESSALLSGEAFHIALRSRRADLAEVICGRGWRSLDEPSRVPPSGLPCLSSSADAEHPQASDCQAPQHGLSVTTEPVGGVTRSAKEPEDGRVATGMSIESLRYAGDLISKGANASRAGLSLELREGKRIQLPPINPFGLVDSVSEVAEHCLIHADEDLLTSPTATASLRQELLDCLISKFDGDSMVVDDRSVPVKRVEISIGSVKATLCVTPTTAAPESTAFLDACMRAVGRANFGDEALMMEALKYLWLKLAHDTG